MSAATSTQCCRECLAVHFSTGSSFPAEWDRADPRLQWNSVYGLSSFTYAAAGAFLLLCFDVAPEVQIPLRLEAACMGFQSLATYMADVRNIGVASAWHPFDRLVATINTVFLGCNLIWVPWIERVAYLLIVASGVIILARSREARKFGALDTFARAHALWHLWLPSGLVLWLAYRRLGLAPETDVTDGLRVVILVLIFGAAVILIGHEIFSRFIRLRRLARIERPLELDVVKIGDSSLVPAVDAV